MKSAGAHRKNTTEEKGSSFFQPESRSPFFSGNGSYMPSVQLKCDSCEREEQKKIQRQELSNARQPISSNSDEASSGVLVEDSATPAYGQMRKTEFLNRLKTEICVSVESALSGTVYSLAISSYIKTVFDKYYSSRPEQIEGLIRQNSPDPIRVRTADEMIQRAKARAYTQATQWVQNGANLMTAGTMINTVTSGISAATNSMATAAGGIVSSVKGLFLKENASGAQTTQSPGTVMQKLGQGKKIESSTRARMETAFGSDFSDVEVHDDNKGAELSSEMNARAFTVGKHVAFGRGEHKPGTLAGDVLMAHELAHVQQQRSSNVNMYSGSSLEKDADQAAAGMAESQYSQRNGKRIQTKKKSGLQIQRCGGSSKAKDAGVADAAVKNAGPFEPYRGKPADELFKFLRTVPKGSMNTKENVANLGNLYTDTNSNDYWYANAILQYGPEAFWPANMIIERNRRGITSYDPNPAELGKTKGSKPVNAYFFPGKSANRALIISGVHGSELSGVEVAETLVTRLQGGFKPFYTVIIVPRLFPDNIAKAEANPSKVNDEDQVGRYTKPLTEPQRQMPAFGKAYDKKTKKDYMGRPIEEENIMLLELIERFRPTRIASIHSKHAGTGHEAGIYADPRTDYKGTAIGYTDDEDLALKMANLAKDKAEVPGNKLDSIPTGRYPQDPPIAGVGEMQERETNEPDPKKPKKREKPKGLQGVSLGGWGSTAVCDPAKPAANRAAMRVITVEVHDASRVQDVEESKKAARQAEINAEVSALREIFLGDVNVEKDEDPCNVVTPKPVAPAKPKPKPKPKKKT